MNRFLGQVARDIADHQLLADQARILVAVSGGVDSIVLLESLHRLGKRRGWELVVAHFNHGLRGREADRDEEFVRAASRRLGWPVVVGRTSSAGRSQRNRLSLEMAARQARHAFLARAAREVQASTVALAHHADDQAELFLVRLLRGAGSEGLGGMKWAGPSPADPAVRLTRPLLGRTRAEIGQFARAWSLSFREDASNARLDILRNRIRGELLPLLRRYYQPAIGTILNRQAALLAAEAEHLSCEARQWLRRPGKSARAFRTLSPALQRRILVDQLLDQGVLPAYSTVEALRTGTPVQLGTGQILSQSGTGRLVMQAPKELVTGTTNPPADGAEGRTSPDGMTLDLALGGGHGAAQFGRYRVSWRLKTGRAPNFRRPEAGREWLDADKLGGKVELRTSRAGDRFQPLGLPRAARLQNLMVNARIPREDRCHRLLATDATGRIWWVDGLRLGEAVKVTSATCRYLEWKWAMK